MTDLSKEFRGGQRVFVLHPDFDEPVVAEGKYTGLDEKDGKHLVVIDHEADAVRRIADGSVSATKEGLGPRLVP